MSAISGGDALFNIIAVLVLFPLVVLTSYFLVYGGYYEQIFRNTK